MKIALRVLVLIIGLGGSHALADKLYNAQTFTLKNGLSVYLIENHRTPVVSHMVVYRVGSCEDPRGKTGLAHFMEHMMFKGPKGSDPERLMGDAQKVGGSVNASTNFDVTSYYEIVPKEHLEHFMKLEASRMRDLPVRLEDANPEIQVVLEEENMRMGNSPMMQFFRSVRGAYYRYHPYGKMPIGWRNEIENYTPEDVKNFHKNHYGPDNAFLILSGDLILAEAKILVEKYYGEIPSRDIPARKRLQEPPLKSVIHVTKFSDRVSEPFIYIMSSAPTYDVANPVPSQAIDIAAYALSNGATGILYRRLVEELKVANSFSISYDGETLDSSALVILASAAKGVTHLELEKKVREELAKIIETGLSEKQLEGFKIQVLSKLDYMKDSLLGGATDLIDPLIKGIPLEQIETWPDALKALKLDDVNKALTEHFAPQYYVAGYLLPEEEKDTPLPESTPQKPLKKDVKNA